MFSRLLSLLLVTFFAISCTKKAEKLGYGLKYEDTLRISILTEPPSLDWSKSTDTTSALIQDNIMDGLVDYKLDDPKLGLKPALATKWESKNQSKTWVFDLRADVKWSDGQAFSAQQVVDGWERLLNPATASEYAYFLFNVKNAKDYNQGKIKNFSKVGVKVNDQGQLEVELEKPQSYFPYLLTHHCTYPIRKDVIEKHGDSWTEPENMVSLGSFNLKVWEHDKAIVLERNDSYYGDKAKIKNVLAYIVDMNTAMSLFDKNKIDAMNELPALDLPRLKKRDEFRSTNILGIYYLGFNVKKAPLDNSTVRKALNMAIDRKEIVKILSGGQMPISGWVPPGMFGYDESKGLEFNPEQAKKLLVEAGYGEGKKEFPKITFAFNTNENHQRVAENVQAQLKKNLGVEVELKNEEWKVYLNTLKVDTPHIYRMGWIADYPDPDNFMNLMTSYSENNHTNWASEAYDKLVTMAVSVTEPTAREKLYQKAQEILTEVDVPVVPVYSYVTHAMVAGRVANYPINTMQKFKYKSVELKKK